MKELLITGVNIVLWFSFTIISTLYSKQFLKATKDPVILSMCSFACGGILGTARFVFSPKARAQARMVLHKAAKDTRKTLLQISLLHLLTTLTTNFSMAFSNVSFTYTIKAAEPLFVAFLSMLLIGKKYPALQLLLCIPIFLGVSMATVTEISFSAWGLFFALFANMSSSTRNIFFKESEESKSRGREYSPVRSRPPKISGNRSRSASSGKTVRDDGDCLSTSSHGVSRRDRDEQDDEYDDENHGDIKLRNVTDMLSDDEFDEIERQRRGSAAVIVASAPKFTSLELYIYTSWFCLWLAVPVWLLRQFTTSGSSSAWLFPLSKERFVVVGDGSDLHLLVNGTTTADVQSSTTLADDDDVIPFHSIIFNLFLGATGHFFYTLFSFQVLSRMTPLSHAVTNVTKRITTILSAIMFFRNPVTLFQMSGVLVSNIAVGFFIYAKHMSNKGQPDTGSLSPAKAASSPTTPHTAVGEPSPIDEDAHEHAGLLPSNQKSSSASLEKEFNRQGGGKASSAMSLERRKDLWVVCLCLLMLFTSMGDWEQAPTRGRDSDKLTTVIADHALAGNTSGVTSKPAEFPIKPSQTSPTGEQIPAVTQPTAAKPGEFDFFLVHELQLSFLTINYISAKILSGPVEEDLLAAEATRQFNRHLCLNNIRKEIRKTMKSVIDVKNPVVFVAPPEHWNLGDSFIALGTFEVLHDFKPGMVPVACTEFHCSNDIIKSTLEKYGGTKATAVFQGGGNFGDLWRPEQEGRLNFVRANPNHNIVFAPQSIWYNNQNTLKSDAKILGAHKNLRILVRDQVSIDILNAPGLIPEQNILFCPDMAFMIGPRDPVADPVVDVLVLSRWDKEKTTDFRDALDRLKKLWDSEGMTYEITDWFDLEKQATWEVKSAPLREQEQYRLHVANRALSRGRIVVSDRLHATVLATLMGKPHVYMDNTYRKISNLRDSTFLEPACSDDNLQGYGATSYEEIADRTVQLVKRVWEIERLTSAKDSEDSPSESTTPTPNKKNKKAASSNDTKASS
ncbi:hypothetical protein HK102_003776 [Quaeritorhiza haematococci]|nr:hypothetical protein HK102_003776 [Quaeritorhiza haematococci]